jgi:hypothetical protein
MLVRISNISFRLVEMRSHLRDKPDSHAGLGDVSGRGVAG